MVEMRIKLFTFILTLLILAISGDGQELKFSLKIQTMSRKSFNTYLYIIKSASITSCTLDSTFPNGDSVFSKTYGTADFTNSLVSAKFTADLYSAITEDTEISHKVTCTDGSETIETTLKTLIVDNSKPNAFTGMSFFVQVERSNLPKTSTTLEIEGNGGFGSCTYQLSSDTTATKDTSTPFNGDENVLTIKFTKTGPKSVGYLEINCVSAATSIQRIIPFTFDNVDPYASASGDPHFAQYVYDHLSKSNKRICYDVTGSSGKYIHIIEFQLEKIMIFGQLKDDYYFHKIVIRSPSANVTVTLHKIFLNDDSKFISWPKDGKDFQTSTKFIDFSLNGKQLIINLKKGFAGKESKEIRIDRKLHSEMEMNLDVSFKMDLSQSRDISGLLGSIGSRQYSFYPSIQEEKAEGYFFVKVGEKLIRGKKSYRNKSLCHLMMVDDLLNPEKVSDYQFEKIN